MKKVVLNGVVFNSAEKAVGGKDEITVFDLVKEYLLEAQLTYGKAVSTIDVLASVGITYDPADTECDPYFYAEFIKLAKTVATEMIKQLKGFGFAADKNKHVDFHNQVLHVQGCTVYTRWPWDVFYKARKAVEHAQSSMNGDHTAYADLAEIKKNHHEIYIPGMAQIVAKKELGIELEKMVADSLLPHYESMDRAVRENKELLTQKFTKLQPSNYGYYEA